MITYKPKVRGSNMKLKIFISHISEEAELAKLLQEHIDRDFLGLLELFVSSDLASISAGSQWLQEIGRALKDAKIELLLCSKRSIQRPWINFEAGAAWVNRSSNCSNLPH